MVIEHIHYSRKREGLPPTVGSFKPSTLPLASVFDRLAASSIDFFVVLAPLLMLIVAPFKANMTQALLLGQQLDFAVALGRTLFMCALVTWLYYFLATWIRGQSVGQWLFGIKVVDHEARIKPSMGASFSRSMILFLEWTFAPWLLLGMFHHRERRCWHDRISDTVVIGLRRQGLAPANWEVALVRGVYAMVFAFGISTVVGSLLTLDRWLTPDSEVASLLLKDEGKNSETCKEVTDFIEPAGRRASFEVDRLDAAMTLFAAGMVEPSCVEAEAAWQIQKENRESALYYLAMAFVEAEEANLSDEYLRAVCEFDQESEACWLSQIVSNWSDLDQVTEVFARGPKEPSRQALVWQVRHQLRLEESQQALVLLDQLARWPGLSSFVASQRAKALWLSHQEREARMAAQLALPLLPRVAQMDLAGWMCYEELARSCEAEAPSCMWVKEANWSEVISGEATQMQSEWLETAMLAEVLRRQGCEAELSAADREELSSTFQSSQVLRLLESEGSEDRLSQLASDTKASARVRTEAARRLIDRVKSSDSLVAVSEGWREMGLKSRILVSHLFKSLMEAGRAHDALQFGVRYLSQEGAIGEIEMRRDMVVLAYQLGRRKDAWTLLRSYKASLEWERLGRVPAAQDEFSVIARVLEEEFER